MNPTQVQDYMQAFINGLAPLAQKIQIPAQTLLGWALQNNYAIAWSELLYMVITLIAAGLFIWFLKGNFPQKDPDLVLMGKAIIIIMLVAGIVVLLVDTLPRFIAPQFHAINDFINIVKQK